MLRSILTLENTIVQNNFPKKERNIRKKGESKVTVCAGREWGAGPRGPEKRGAALAGRPPLHFGYLKA